jgi:predicted transcriptional regulator
VSKKRERITIIYDILKAIQDKGNETKPTHILYKSNLSSQMLKEYLTELIEKGMIKEKTHKKGNKTYVLEELGFKYLSDYKVIKKFMESYDLDE